MCDLIVIPLVFKNFNRPQREKANFKEALTRLTNVNADLKKQASTPPPGLFQPVKKISPPGFDQPTQRRNSGLMQDEINLLKAQLDSALQDIDLKEKQIKNMREGKVLEKETQRNGF